MARLLIEREKKWSDSLPKPEIIIRCIQFWSEEAQRKISCFLFLPFRKNTIAQKWREELILNAKKCAFGQVVDSRYRGNIYDELWLIYHFANHHKFNYQNLGYGVSLILSSLKVIIMEINGNVLQNQFWKFYIKFLRVSTCSRQNDDGWDFHFLASVNEKMALNCNDFMEISATYNSSGWVRQAFTNGLVFLRVHQEIYAPKKLVMHTFFHPAIFSKSRKLVIAMSIGWEKLILFKVRRSQNGNLPFSKIYIRVVPYFVR